MGIMAHIKEQPFVAATAAAALVHSSWSLGTLFSGVQPLPPALGAEGADWFVFAVKTLAWHAPAVAIAFAFDVGQIVTAHEIRKARGNDNKGLGRKLLTFVVFAISTYYLQLLYCAAHFPDLALGAGVSDGHRAAMQAVLDAAVWIVPAFLPLSTLLYTFSSDDAHTAPETATDAPETVTVSADTTARVSKPQRPAPAPKTPPQAPALPQPVEPTAALPAPLQADAVLPARKPRKTKVSMSDAPPPMDGLWGDVE